MLPRRCEDWVVSLVAMASSKMPGNSRDELLHGGALVMGTMGASSTYGPSEISETNSGKRIPSFVGYLKLWLKSLSALWWETLARRCDHGSQASAGDISMLKSPTVDTTPKLGRPRASHAMSQRKSGISTSLWGPRSHNVRVVRHPSAFTAR